MNKDWETTISINLLAPVHLDRGFLPQMVVRKTGVIIHIASIQGKLPLYNSTLPKVIADLVMTQNNINSMAYAACFAETAVVFDEGKMHKEKKKLKIGLKKQTGNIKQ